jgi:hypothetical protein
MGLATNRLANLSISSQASRHADEELSLSSGYTRTGSGAARGTEQSDVALNMTEEERAKQALLKLGCFTNLDAYMAVGLEDWKSRQRGLRLSLPTSGRCGRRIIGVFATSTSARFGSGERHDGPRCPVAATVNRVQLDARPH